MIIAFGGYRDHALSPTNDLVGYIVDENTWLLLRSKGRKPSPRAAHSCCTYGKRCIFFFGGNEKRRPVDSSLFRFSAIKGALRGYVYG